MLRGIHRFLFVLGRKRRQRWHRDGQVDLRQCRRRALSSEGILHPGLMVLWWLPAALCPSPALSLSIPGAPWRTVNSVWQSRLELIKMCYRAYHNRALILGGPRKELRHKGSWACNKNMQSDVIIGSQSKDLRVGNAVPLLKMVLRLILNVLVSDN